MRLYLYMDTCAVHALLSVKQNSNQNCCKFRLKFIWISKGLPKSRIIPTEQLNFRNSPLKCSGFHTDNFDLHYIYVCLIYLISFIPHLFDTLVKQRRLVPFFSSLGDAIQI